MRHRHCTSSSREDRYRDQASAAGVGDRVHFLGPVPHAELPGVLRGVDLLLLTTQPPESFGIVLIEAMASGLPTIATDYPGVRAVIDDGATGIVVKPQDPAAVAAAIRRLIEAGPDGRARMGAAGREKAERLWSWPRLLDRMEDAYAAAIAARRVKLG
jgi:D-inositol-3-phosphate glycosyltransferase